MIRNSSCSSSANLISLNADDCDIERLCFVVLVIEVSTEV